MIAAAPQQTSDALTTGNIIAIVALCAVVVGALIGPFWAYLASVRRRVKALERRLDLETGDGDLYRDLVATAAGRGFAGASNSLEFLAGMLQRIFDGRLGEIESARALGKLHGHRSEVERAWMELRLLTGDRAEQTSALQQLKRLGDELTLQNMELQLQDDPGTVQRERFEATMDVIRERIDANEE